MSTNPRNLSAFIAKSCGVLAALVLLSGCVVTSIYPHYHAKDLRFDPALLGTWVEADKTNSDQETWTFELVAEKTYKLIVTDNDKKTEFDTHLFQLKGQLFLDFLPRERPENSAPLHFVMRVDALAPQLEWRMLKYDWLAKLVERNPKTIRHVVVPRKAGDGSDGGDLVVTADTDELQKFLARHRKTADAWSDKVVLKKR